ncbi:DUF4270 family protein [Paraflavitalea sp. CAU 1676]|uniref:DUF4270 family protein n=1 Tax=Paraflavitalea sp. CAU 1676 TaxID=3032598 RepID=UPI0023DC3795|nr:DUF4270 family protein [Paraflavitalea sp. CAU 1676]MDF2190007.1 DUF4270 family protein [Paraflavitalea sp. CAU 1676]
MTLPKSVVAVLFSTCLSSFLLSACYKDEIKFGNLGDDNYTRLITIDTITPVISTVVLDSFPTSGTGKLLIGRWEDPHLGATMASTYFQLGLPADISSITFPNDAVYDSLSMTLKPDKHYYGDTSKAQTFSVYELAYQPEYSYASKLFNTSVTAKLSAALGSTTQLIRPSRNDSLQIRLPQTRGAELFNKIKLQAAEMKSEDAFLNYLRGFCIQVNAQDKGAIFSFTADSSVMMKLYYHTTIPVYQEHVISFSLTRTGYQYNQVSSNRTNTPLQPGFAGQTEFFTSEAYPYAFTQAGTGVMMKIKFPSLRNVLGLSSVVKLLNAKLIIKPIEQSFDNYGFRLPDTLFLAQTDATNGIGDALPGADGTTAQYTAPSIDYIYRLNTQYSFDVSSYVSYLLNSAGNSEGGVFVLEEYPGSAKKLNRALMGAHDHAKYKTQLSVTVMTVQ